MSIKQILMAHGAYVGEEYDSGTGELKYLIKHENGLVCAYCPFVAGSIANWLNRP